MSRGGSETLVRAQYDSLVKLAYLAADPHLGRHRRVLAAHGAVQGLSQTFSPPTGSTDDHQVHLYAATILKSGERLRPGSGLEVRGLRFFPTTDAVDSLSLELKLNALSRDARVFWALSNFIGLEDSQALEVLRLVGSVDPQSAAAEAVAVGNDRELGFDPCQVRLAPTAQRRRPKLLLVAIALAIVMASCAGIILYAGRDTPTSHGGQSVSTAGEAAGAQKPARVDASRWRTTARLDFSAWPARGSRVGDVTLTAKAEQLWRDGRGLDAVAGAPTLPPHRNPSLLYADTIGDQEIVLLFDGDRLARYTAPVGGGTARMLIARADDADLMNSAAVAIAESPQGRQFLLAPWIVETRLRDLTDPKGAPTAVSVTQGVTAPVPAPSGCSARPALQLRSSPLIAEKHAFVIADLGDLTPVHLTWMPPPGKSPARSPREVTSPTGLNLWAQTACDLWSLRGRGLRSASNWIFAEQVIPETGQVNWVCTRTESWSGDGTASVNLLNAGGLKVPAGAATGTSACSRFGQDVFASARWRSPGGQTYLLAAGSRRVSRVVIGSGPSARSVGGPVAALGLTSRTTPHVSGRLTDGRVIQTFSGGPTRRR